MKDHSIESKFVKQLDEDISAFIHRDSEDQNDERFNELALREFELQYLTIKPYREYCKKRNLSPETISHWEQIPAIPSPELRAFISSLPFEQAEQVCLTNGNIVPDGRQKIFRDKKAIDLINLSNEILVKSFLFPDVEQIRILLMLPSPKMAPLMDKAIGLEKVRLKFGTSDSRFLISPIGLDIKALLRGMKESAEAGKPLALIGVTGALIQFLNACEREGIKLYLPQGSRICDLERRRGLFGECPKEDYFKKCKEVLGVGEDSCINVLWICESSTIYFDNALRNHILGKEKVRCKEIPSWARITAVDTKDFRRLPKGEIGLLRHYDLTNHAFAVQTANLGFETREGFDVIGLWNKKMGGIDIDHSAGHPGGKIVSQALVYLMRHKLSKIGKIYSGLRGAI